MSLATCSRDAWSRSSTADFKNTFKKGIEEIFAGETLEILLDERLIEIDKESFKATPVGRQKLDSLIQFLFSDFDLDPHSSFFSGAPVS